jgi:hypothetical protein
MTLALGTEGAALSEALWTMANFVEDVLNAGESA